MESKRKSGRRAGQAAGVTRRGFLKSTALAGIAAGVFGPSAAGLAGCTPVTSGAKAPNVATGGYRYDAELAPGEWHHCACQRNCYDTCAMLCKVTDGKLTRVKGDPDNPYTKGGLCVKTQSYVDWCYSPDRILYPLRRTGEKGPGCSFERISWDEAIDEITSRWKGIIDEHGGEAITWSRFQGNQGAVNRRAIDPLFFRMGATYQEGTMCDAAYAAALPYCSGEVPNMNPEDIPTKDLYISWGHNPCATSLHSMKFVKEMNKNGGKIVVINPIAVPETMWADLFVQLRPGTDIPFALAVGKHLIDNGMYDADWIAQWGSGFDDYRAACDEWPAEKAADRCGIPAEQIGQFAELLWENRANACYKVGSQLGRRANGGMANIAIICVPALIGHPECYYNQTTSGGFANNLAAMQDEMFHGTIPTDSNPVGTVRNYASPDLGRVLTSQNFGPDHNFADNPIRSLFVYGSNPMVSHPNQNLVQQGLEREDLFTVVHDMFMTPTCEYADIILPAPSSFEYEEFNGGYGHNYSLINEKIIEPLGECKANWEVCNLLGQAMGYDDEAFHRDEQWFRDHLLAKKDFTYDELLEKGWVYEDPGTFEAVYEEGFDTPTGKFQFASDELEHDLGTRAPQQRDDDPESLTGDASVRERFPFALLTVTAKEFLNGCFGNLPDNNILFGGNYLFLNDEDAAEAGIAEGDRVRVYNDRGEAFRQARVFHGLTARHVAYTYKSTWYNKTGEANGNRLTNDVKSDLGRSTCYMSTMAAIEKA